MYAYDFPLFFKLLEEADLDENGYLSYAEFENVIARSPEFMKWVQRTDYPRQLFYAFRFTGLQLFLCWSWTSIKSYGSEVNFIIFLIGCFIPGKICRRALVNFFATTQTRGFT